jgi:membrane-associated phospholipid phosphatase
MPTPDVSPTAGRHGHPNPLLTDHRRGLLYGGVLIAATIGMVLGVGIHPTEAAPVTTLPLIGHVDASVYDAMVRIRGGFLTAIFKVFNVTGSGVVTIPLRVALLGVLLWRRRWGASAAFALAWLVSEVGLQTLKMAFHRGRPPVPLVLVSGYSFPSGHATAGAAIAVSVVLAFFPHGVRRRKWIAAAIAFAFAMAFSRVYLGAHWLSDVETGVLLGTSVALLSFAVVDEIRHTALRRAAPDGRMADVASPRAE